LVIFDCDGVLVDSEQASFEVARAIAAELGIELSFEQNQPYFGTRDSDMFEDLAAKHGMALPEGFLVRVEERKIARYREGVTVIPGAMHAVRRIAAAGLPLCVASSATVECTRVKLEPIGLLEFFGDHVFTAYDVARGKPAPDISLHAAERMGVAPANCVVVEDAAAGVRSGVDAGMRVLGFAPKGDVLGFTDLGAEAFPSLTDVPRLIGL
jgi:HAD superfamily hydrolase (TIGR01509 family)